MPKLKIDPSLTYRLRRVATGANIHEIGTMQQQLMSIVCNGNTYRRKQDVDGYNKKVEELEEASESIRRFIYLEEILLNARKKGIFLDRD